MGVRLPPWAPTLKKGEEMKSEKFVNTTIPCKVCLVSPMCEALSETKDDLKLETLDELYNSMIVLKKWDERKKILKKGIIEAWINMGFSIIESTYVKNGTYIKPDYEGFPEKSFPVFTEILDLITRALKIIMQSKSWEDSVEYQVDKERLLYLVKHIQKVLETPGSHSG